MQSTALMTREQWLAERRKGLGGSDAAAILGMNPYKSPLAVYMDKLALIPESETTEAQRQGTDLEQYVAERFCEATEKKVRRVNRILQHPEYPWMLANIDRDVVGENSGLECKTTSVFNKTAFDQGDVPATYYWQCQWYMAVTGADSWYLAILVLNSAFHTFEISRNDEHIALLIETARNFWHNHVLAKVPPLPSGSENDGELVNALPATNAEGDVIDLQEIENEIALRQTLKADLKALEARVGAIDQSIALKLSGASTGRTNRYTVAYTPRVKKSIDSKRLRAEMPDIAEQFTQTTEYREMRIKEVKQ